MDKIVGKFLYSVLLLTHSWIGAATVTLHALDMHNKSVQKVVAGESFKLVVRVADGTIEHVMLKDNEHLIINGRETRMHIINGNRTTEYVYIASLNNPGMHEIGPATVVIDGEKIVSNTLSLNVGVEKTVSKEEIFFARFYINKKTAFVGECLECFLEIYCADDGIQLQHIGQPQSPQATITLIKPPHVSGTKVINGITYTCAQCNWNVYPTKPGMLVIPAVTIDYTTQQKNSAVGFFWAPSYTPKRIYSNSLAIDVAALPPHDPPIQAIGDFSTYTAHIEPAVSKQGEGIVFKLELIGEGNTNAIIMPSLVGMPTCFKWYESKTYDTPTTHKKSFEYIVQGMKVGEWTIPSQQFTYFNVKSKRYVTLETAPVQIKINAGSTTSQPPENSISTHHEHHDNLPLLDDRDIRPIYEVNDRPSSGIEAIPTHIFIALLSMPLGLSIMLLFKRTIMIRRDKHLTITKKKAFTRARKELQRVVKENAGERIHPIFVQLFGNLRANIPESLREHDIENILKNAPLSEELLRDWYDFWLLSSAALFSKDRQNIAPTTLFTKAQQWLDILESKL